jgi:hypothetical protein
MDTKQLIADAKARFSHNSAKAYLKDKYKSKLTIASQGGLWNINPQLLSQLASSPAENLILLDSFENPIKVNRKDLLELLNNVYVTVMDDWHTEWKELENKR